MRHLQDDALVRRCLENDDAFACLMARYQSAIYRFTYYWTGNRDDALDLCQECFIQIFKGLPRYDSRYPFSTWMYRVCTRVCLNWKQAARRVRTPQLVTNRTAEELDVPDPSPRFEDLLIRQECRQTVLDAVEALPERFRMPLVLKYLQDLSYKEISAILGISAKNAEIRVHRAKVMLLDQLKDSVPLSDLR